MLITLPLTLTLLTTLTLSPLLPVAPRSFQHPLAPIEMLLCCPVLLHLPFRSHTILPLRPRAAVAVKTHHMLVFPTPILCLPTLLCLSAPPITSATPLVTDFCFHGTAINPDNGKIANYKELLTCSTAPLWATANSLEIGWLFQGLGPHSAMPTGTNCCFFIHKHNMLTHKCATYIRIVCADRPGKTIPQRICWTAGGDHVIYTGNVSTKTADLTTAKCLFNSTISTPNGRFMTLDLSVYLESHLSPAEYEYVRIPIWMIPPHIQILYNLAPKIIDGHIYAEIRRGMYGLPQAGKLANDQLAQFLLPHHYLPCPVTPGLWMDTTSDLMFLLVVDDFGVRYTKRSDVERLVTTLCTKYHLATDWTGSRYIGLMLMWDYEHCTIDLTIMPG